MRKALGAYVFAGGFTVGVKRHFDVVAHLEGTPPYGARTVRANWPEMPIHPGPDKWPVGEFDRLVRGDDPIEFVYCNPPCAVFSSMGIVTTRGKDSWRTDPRTQCWHDSFGLLTKIRPRALVIESVCQAYTRGREMIDDMTRSALTMGYSVTHLMHDAKWMGLPQSRRRFFFVAHRASALVGLQHNWAPPPTIGEVLAEVPDPGHYTRHKRADWITLIENTPPGGRLCHTYERLNPGCLEILNAQGNVKGRPSFQERRLDANETMGAWTGDKFFHPTETRAIGLEECKAICGFPPDFVVAPEDLSGFGSLLARGVMPPVGEWIARVVDQTLEQPDVGNREDLRVTYTDLREPDRPNIDLTRDYLNDRGRVVVRVRAAMRPLDVEDEPEQPPAPQPPMSVHEVRERAPAPAPAAPTPAAPIQLVPVDGNIPPLAGEGSGKYIKRLWMTGQWSHEEILALVHKNYPGRKTRKSDIYYNYRALLTEGVPNVPPWSDRPTARGRSGNPPSPPTTVDAALFETPPDVPDEPDPEALNRAEERVMAYLASPAVISNPLPKPTSGTAIVDWFPRICGATDYCGHLQRAAPDDAELVSFSKRGGTDRWTSWFPWRSYKAANAADILNDYDNVVLGDVACFSPNVWKTKDERPFYLEIMERVRTRFTAIFHGGTYPTKHDPTMDAIFSAPGFTGSIVTPRKWQAAERLAKWPQLRIVHRPYLPYSTELRQNFIAPTRERSILMTARIATNKGQNALLKLLPELNGNVNIWGYNAFGFPSIMWRLWEFGNALGYTSDGPPALRADSASLTHPNAPKFYTGKLAFTAPNGRRFDYHDAYGQLSDVNWAPWIFTSLPSRDFAGIIEYTPIDAIHQGCVVVVPENCITESVYETLVTVPYEGCTSWYNIDTQKFTGEERFNHEVLVNKLNDLLSLDESELENLAAAQRAEAEELHDPAVAWSGIIEALNGS